MKFILAFGTWLVMAAVLVLGIVLAVREPHSLWLLIAGVVAFFVAVGKIGCATH